MVMKGWERVIGVMRANENMNDSYVKRLLVSWRRRDVVRTKTWNKKGAEYLGLSLIYHKLA